MAWQVYAMIYVSGFAGLLAIFAFVQFAMHIHEGKVAPMEAVPIVIGIAATWPLLVLLFIIASLTVNLKSMPKQVSKPFMTDKRFAFTVTIRGETWDCYHFKSSDGKIGTVGFTKRGRKFVIGLMCTGHLTEAEALHKLEESDRAEVN